MSASASPVSDLKDLGVTAVLGSDRAGRDAQAPVSVLSRAAVAGARARAGRHFRADVSSIEACPADDEPSATIAQTATLDRLLAQPDAALIEEWCTLARARGVHVPAISVPVLLDWWSRQPSRSPVIFEATGACGSWLARLNADWRKPVPKSETPANADEAWQTGTFAERAALLATIRQNDAVQALELVRATWSADGAEDRRRFVEILGQTVSSADEAFLEAALDDRSKLVRREAAGALVRLAGSALRARMRERATRMILIEKSKSSSRRPSAVKVKLEPPKVFDKSWERDAIDEQAITGKGKRASWMVQVLSATDLSIWTELSGLAPAELIDAVRDDEYFDDAVQAITASAASCPGQKDLTAWTDAIIAMCAGKGSANPERVSQVWAAQSVERSEEMRLRFLSAEKPSKGAVVWHLLVSDSRAWSLDFSVRALAICRETTPKKIDTWELWGPVESVSRLLHPGAAETFERLIGDLYPDGPSESIRKSLDRVRLRADMHREFQS